MLLGVTNLITVVDHCIPRPVVRGLQLGLGFSMFTKALELMPEKGVCGVLERWLEFFHQFTLVHNFACAVLLVRL